MKLLDGRRMFEVLGKRGDVIRCFDRDLELK